MYSASPIADRVNSVWFSKTPGLSNRNANRPKNAWRFNKPNSSHAQDSHHAARFAANHFECRATKRMRKERIWIAVGLTSGLLLLSSALGQVSPGGGQVLNTSTEGPVGDAKVTLVCRKQYFGLGHGSTSVIRTVAVSSNKDGAYAFSFFDVVGCSYAEVYAEKEGYVSAAQVHVRYQANGNETQIPKISYLTPVADVVMLRLKLLGFYETGKVHFQDGRYAAAVDYQGLYSHFFEAKLIAQTDQEKNFVRATFCQKLVDLYRALSEVDKEELSRYSLSVHFRDKYATGTYAHDAEVVTYCDGIK